MRIELGVHVFIVVVILIKLSMVFITILFPPLPRSGSPLFGSVPHAGPGFLFIFGHDLGGVVTFCDGFLT